MSWKSIVAALLLVLSTGSFGLAEKPKKVLLLGDKGSHGPGSHEHMPGLRILAKCLQGVPGLEVSLHQADGDWPEGPRLLKDADGIVLFLDEGSRWEQATPERQEALRALRDRGGGVVCIHWAIGGKDAKYIPFHLALLGGCHGGPDRKYVVTETDLKVVDRQHPITSGVEDLRVKEEFYYQLKFADKGTIQPLLKATIDGRPETAAWAFERPGGGRSFGFCCMHYHDSWKIPACRRLIAQGLLWTLKMPVPEEGLPVKVTEEDLKLK